MSDTEKGPTGSSGELPARSSTDGGPLVLASTAESLKTFGPISPETGKPILAPIQQHRIRTFGHFVDRFLECQEKLSNEGRPFFYPVHDEKGEKEKDERGQEKKLLITDRVINQWGMMIHDLHETFLPDETMTRAASESMDRFKARFAKKEEEKKKFNSWIEVSEKYPY